MKTKTLLRFLSIVVLIQFAGHFTLFLKATPHNGQEEAEVVNAMRSHFFKFGGTEKHSYWQLYFGYGLMSALTVLIQSLLYWQLSRFTKMGAAFIRSIIAVFTLATFGHLLLLFAYFSFLLPMAFDLTAILLLVLAFVSAGKKETLTQEVKQ